MNNVKGLVIRRNPWQEDGQQLVGTFEIVRVEADTQTTLQRLRPDPRELKVEISAQIVVTLLGICRFSVTTTNLIIEDSYHKPKSLRCRTEWHPYLSEFKGEGDGGFK